MIPLGSAVESAIDLDREAAREQALRELSDPRYSADDPNLIERILQRAFEELGEIIDGAASVVPGGLWGLAALAVVIGAVGIAVAVGGTRVLRERGARTPGALMATGDARTAADYRRLADAAADEQRWADAVVARMRAVVRTHEERGLIDLVPGRTADESAAAIANVVGEGDALLAAARSFDEVAFGRRPGSQAQYSLIAGLDERLQRAPVLS